ncbi:hypothetical protein FMZ60_09730 [Alcaligenaceae bacterium SJ-26]|nr:hypothetical protein FMZ60_09730 [Alcaligenaceae bacterium SJ-26]
MRLKQLSVACMMFCLSAVATAAEYYVDIKNKTGVDIYFVYVSPQSTTDWEEDVMEEDILENGEEIRITLTNYDNPMFDVKLVDENDKSYTFYGVNVEERDIVATKKNMDKGD